MILWYSEGFFLSTVADLLRKKRLQFLFELQNMKQGNKYLDWKTD